MATSKLFKKVPLQAPNRSGFNMSYNNFFSAPVATLVPSHIDFLIPGDEIDLSSKLHVQLPPMATDFYGRIEAKEEAFFVPCRILFGGWKDFYVNPVDGTTNPSNIDGQLAKYLIGAAVPASSFVPKEVSSDINLLSNGSLSQDNFTTFLQHLINLINTAVSSNDPSVYFDITNPLPSNLGPGSLMDYLGFKIGNVSASNTTQLIEILGFFGTIISTNLSTISYSLYQKVSSISSSYRNGSKFAIRLSGFVDIIETNDPNISVNVPDDQAYLMLTYYSNSENSFDSFLTEFYFYDNSSDIYINNILPILAYHKIYDDWYRAPQIQQSLFKRNVANASASTSVANMPWITSGADQKIYFSGNQLTFANGHNLFDLHQRNWQKDYFTSATPEPQAGDASSVKFDVVDDSGEFTIASLRAANALQQWLDRNNIGGFRYGDMIYAQYGVYPSDAITDRAIYLGSTSVEVYNKSVYQQSGDGGSDTNNPFNAIGSKYSNPTGVGSGQFCNNYRVTEAGFVIKIFSLVPQAYYSTGVRRFFMHNDISDIAFPVLAGVGDQPIYGRELTNVYSGTGDDTVFGYQQRYADYKFIDDQVHGLLRDGESLDSFALQRSFSEVPQLGSDFLQIPREYLDQVSATDYKLSQYGCWVNCYNSYLKSSTLPAYSIPTLEDMKGHTILVEKGGSYIA